MGKADAVFDEVLAVMSGDAAQTVDQAVDQLTFSSYRSHRDRGMTATQCAVFPDSEALEQRYWDEINAYTNRMVQRDKEARHTGDPRHDRDFVGRILKAGH
jgi:hypothetical protein